MLTHDAVDLRVLAVAAVIRPCLRACRHSVTAAALRTSTDKAESLRSLPYLPPSVTVGGGARRSRSCADYVSAVTAPCGAAAIRDSAICLGCGPRQSDA